jgi:hypothetical protein
MTEGWAGGLVAGRSRVAGREGTRDRQEGTEGPGGLQSGWLLRTLQQAGLWQAVDLLRQVCCTLSRSIVCKCDVCFAEVHESSPVWYWCCQRCLFSAFVAAAVWIWVDPYSRASLFKV